jgi:hypothetical protein
MFEQQTHIMKALLTSGCLIFFLFSGTAFGQGIAIPSRTVFGTVNNLTHPIAGAMITVCAANAGGIPCAPALTNTIFSNTALTQPLSNPFFADANGNYQFVVALGTYTVTETAPGFAGYSYQVSSTGCNLGVCVAANGINTFTNVNTFTQPIVGTINGLTGPGAISGTFSGNSTLSRNLTETGIFLCKQIEQTFCVDSTNTGAWSGADIAAWTNSAYAACAAAAGKTSCKITVAQNPTGACYTPTTLMNFSRNGVPPIIDFGGACFDYSAITAPAAPYLIADWGTGIPQGYGGAISNLRILGPCTTTACAGVGANAIAISLGPTHGVAGTLLSNIVLGGFSSGKGFVNGISNASSSSFINTCLNCEIYSSNIGVNVTASTESLAFIGGAYSQNATAFNVITAGAEVSISQLSCDDNTTTCLNQNNGTVFVSHVHHENVGGGTAAFIAMSGGNLHLLNSNFQDDVASGGPQSGMVSCSAGTVFAESVDAFSSGRTYSQIFNLTGTCAAQISINRLASPMSTTPIITPGYAGGFVQIRDINGGKIFSTQFVTRSANPPATSLCVLCVSSVDNIWAQRNNANTGDIFATKNASDQLNLSQYAGLLPPPLVRIANGTGLQVFNTATTCTTAASVGAVCTTAAIPLPVAYTDTNYRLSCTGQGVSNVPIVETYTKSNTTFTITVAALTAAAARFTAYDCIAGHN